MCGVSLCSQQLLQAEILTEAVEETLSGGSSACFSLICSMKVEIKTFCCSLNVVLAEKSEGGSCQGLPVSRV